jgi:Xaa-Pro dipeptidase
MNTERLRQVMNREGFDALVASTPENVFYLTGFSSLNQRLFRGYQTYAIYARDDGVEPILIAGKSDADEIVQSECKIKEVHFYGSFYIESRGAVLRPIEERLSNLIQKESSASAPSVLVDLLRQLGLDRGSIGMDEMNIPPPIYEEIAHNLPRAVLQPANTLFRSIRAVKTQPEIESLRSAASITEKAILSSLEIAREGTVTRELAKAIVDEIASEGAVPTLVVVGSGDRIAFPNARAGEYRLRKEDLIRFDVGCTYNNYHADIGRTAVVQSPPERIRNMYQALLDGLERAIDRVTAGVRASDIFETAMNTVRSRGIQHYRRQHCGHGIGVEIYEIPSVTSTDETKLEPNMVLNVETPYYELGVGGLIVEDTLVVKKNGYELLSTTPRDMFQI